MDSLGSILLHHPSFIAEHRIPRLADYDYGHSCEKGFSLFRENPFRNSENPFSVAESGSMPLGVSRLPSPQQLPALSSHPFFNICIGTNEINWCELSPSFWGS